MSHSGGAPASSGPTQSPSAPGGGSHPVSSSPASLVVGGSAYPAVPPPPPSLIGTHPLSSGAAHHPHLAPHTGLYHAPFDMLWKSGRAAAYMPAHLLAAVQQGAAAEDMLTERALAMQDRDRQERIFR